MLYNIQDGSKWVDGYAIAAPDKKTDGLYSLAVSIKTNGESEIIRLALTKGEKGPDRTKVAEYIKKGDRIIAAVNEVQKGEYTNYYVNQIAWCTPAPRE